MAETTLNRWSYEELEEFVGGMDKGLTDAREGGSYVKAFEKMYHKDFRGYKWVNSDMNAFVVRGLDETMRIALGAEMSGHSGWKYPILDYWCDAEQGIIWYEWVMVSPWPTHEGCYNSTASRPALYEPYTNFYLANGTGYTMHWYAGDMQSLEQEDLAEAPPLQFSHEQGLATGQMSKTLEDQFYLRRAKEKQALIGWKEYLEDLREEYGQA